MQLSEGHFIECSGLKNTLTAFILCIIERHSMLDAALNNTRIWKNSRVWGKMKKGPQSMERVLMSDVTLGARGNPGVKQIGGGS